MVKLFDSELKIMEVLWREGDLPAAKIAAILQEETGWNRNTTYTVIKKCIEKGAVERYNPKFMCHALVSRQEVQSHETEELIDKMFNGSKKQFFAAFLSGASLSDEEITQLKEMVEKLK
ncbi:transcriptional regulator, BlaI/MecI/CopY family [Marvinbryantia formatexigens DSM 14469]|uniref:Transcriptional regulator, BlaI/MecI/CopY family n=1 Tax=Marvinbryantia formatexigens DSM 14469 TaxID=478749 RepID=C6LAY6_9FIRM|nr:BlaI/MecI/CopY family transcriptional regulator [Marvinbryantia formatexigens]EET62117.1 transcriptional regulator, BlaI/MecI/CopY family [Marvinbryantia formatexigens DSM 14469]UWO26531.1 BlaI/MecI/CopY family transcriptional regulator [Marvinbryantia formatexigens DSM 14469]SDF77179.1 Predicted transcriptional regulator [Marvinbryantia formatexigens]